MKGDTKAEVGEQIGRLTCPNLTGSDQPLTEWGGKTCGKEFKWGPRSNSLSADPSSLDWYATWNEDWEGRRAAAVGLSDTWGSEARKSTTSKGGMST